MNQKNVQAVYEELLTTYQNLKAEIYVTEILENSDLDLTDIDVFNQSTFSRSYRRDVIDFKVDSFSSTKDKLQLKIARNSLYDTLPEGLFHDSIKTKNNTLSYSELHQKQKKQEQDARSFFAPLENEFFTQKVHIEQNERNLINEFTNLKTDFLLKFWKLDKKIPAKYSIKLLQLLPYAHKISGEIELTALSLEKIIDENVSIQKKYKTIEEKSGTSQPDNKLGVNFTLEVKESIISYPYWEITIGPVEKENIDKYLVNSATYKFIAIFCDYFIPMEIDTEINIEYANKGNTFALNESNNPRMGLTTII
ncbi:type VI secretion system baseplate subunit TssG [Aquimarina addita]|uniref:Type VI secretion system baseplate subunit TssG n=1 Tax=Aquimarina addita TaxID=870485 RepID=A0ABP6US34_9FLAO